MFRISYFVFFISRLFDSCLSGLGSKPEKIVVIPRLPCPLRGLIYMNFLILNQDWNCR
ncbi:hypothetical protein KsCSTR_41310 [Candidatus Kuenenia stuttgartiensis]|uniref:Uncharacterized protein n=1 Tax=Kuenenia stuttgartiensis TaxID=174633 RepID=Q1PXQ1_KUEST|nr:hypothetical protein KsCSTR_41310 [Candidatus Kuenenia stuttgartiensis]CAJ72005.1 unknown protein [Candidatus Kuenenia stuttgartiensis]